MLCVLCWCPFHVHFRGKYVKAALTQFVLQNEKFPWICAADYSCKEIPNFVNNKFQWNIKEKVIGIGLQDIEIESGLDEFLRCRIALLIKPKIYRYNFDCSESWLCHKSTIKMFLVFFLFRRRPRKPCAIPKRGPSTTSGATAASRWATNSGWAWRSMSVRWEDTRLPRKWIKRYAIWARNSANTEK